MKKTILLTAFSFLFTLQMQAQDKAGLFKTGFLDKDPWADQIGYMIRAGVTTGKDFDNSGVQYKNFGAHCMINTHFSILSFFYKKSPIIISDYETVGLGLGIAKVEYRYTFGHDYPLWVGFDLGLGGQILLRFNKNFDLGTRLFYGGLVNSARSNSQDEGWFISPNIRINNYYIEYTKTYKPKRSGGIKYPLNIFQLKHINQENGKQIGIRIEFGSREGDSFANGQTITLERNSLCVQFCFSKKLW